MEKLSSKSRVSEVDTACARIIGAYKKTSLSSDPHMDRIYGELEEMSLQLSNAINPNKALSEMEARDEARDKRLRAFYHRVKSSAMYSEDSEQVAAESLLGIFEKYGLSMLTETYAMESSLITSMLNDYSDPEMQEALSKVPGCENYITAIQKAQDEFEAARIAYGEVKSKEGQQDTASALKAEILVFFNDTVLFYTWAMARVDDAQYGSFARTIGEFIDENNAVVNMRFKKTLSEAQ